MKIVTGDYMRRLDKRAIEDYKIPGINLMENAGKSVVDFIEKEIPDLQNKKVAILCGKGNNGGDGLVIARLLLKKKVKTDIFIAAKKEDLEGDPKENLHKLIKEKITIKEIKSFSDFEKSKQEIKNADIIVDALLGTGFKGIVSGMLAKLIEYVNSLKAKKVAVDVPSGLNSSDGRVLGPCIKADYTVTLGLMKAGLIVYPGLIMPEKSL